MVAIHTDRLTLRDWRDADLAPWAAMNADPEVREHLGPLLTAEQALASLRNFQHDLDRNGFGFWAVEVRESREFIGFAGLDRVDDGLPLTGVEAGWRLARSAWGHGYATESAIAVLAYGFTTVDLAEILAITTATNLRSQAVMRRIGMTTDPADDFDDPDVEDGPLRRQVVHVTVQPSAAGRRLVGPCHLRRPKFGPHRVADTRASGLVNRVHAEDETWRL